MARGDTFSQLAPVLCPEQQSWICHRLPVLMAVSMILHTNGLRRGGMKPACGSAHACDDRRCRHIYAVSGTAMPIYCSADSEALYLETIHHRALRYASSTPRGKVSIAVGDAVSEVPRLLASNGQSLLQIPRLYQDRIDGYILSAQNGTIRIPTTTRGPSPCQIYDGLML